MKLREITTLISKKKSNKDTMSVSEVSRALPIELMTRNFS